MKILVLRNVRADMTSRGGFIWPHAGHVEAHDYEDTDDCGNGLHGLPWGIGGNYRYSGNDSVWLVVRVDTSRDYRHGAGKMTDKCKFRCGEVVYSGSRDGAIRLITEHAPTGLWINFSNQTAGDDLNQVAGCHSTQTAGNRSIQKAGYYSTQAAGIGSTQVTGNHSMQRSGKGSTQTGW